MSTSRTAAGSETALLSYSWRQSIIINFFRRYAYHSQHPQGSWYFRCLVFPRQYRAVVHWIRGPSSTLSKTYQITLLSLFFKLSSCERFTYTLLLVWDVARHGISTPFLKKHVFFFSDTRFVIRAIYLPSLFQPLPRWSLVIQGPPSIIQWDNYTLYVNVVGRIHGTCPSSMNPVGVAIS